MSKIGDLKANENNKVNLVKILELFCNGDTKYVEMLLRIYKTSGDSTTIKVNAINKRTGIDIDKIKALTDNEIEILYHFIDNTMLMGNIKDFQKFINYNERNLIDDNDLQGYKSFTQITGSVKRADEKIALKELEKQIIKIHEDDNWLILIPITYEASKKYGYNTKWCTASESTSEQYKSYTRDGTLIYIIHKGHEKTAVYKKRTNGEISFWNQVDTRIDSIQTNFPNEIMEIVKTALNTNYDKKYNPNTGITNLSDLIKPDGVTGLTMSMLEDLLKVNEPYEKSAEKWSPTNDNDWMEKRLTSKVPPGWGRSELVSDPHPPTKLTNDDLSGGGSRGVHIKDAAEAHLKAYEQLLNLNSPDYISRVKGLMQKLK